VDLSLALLLSVASFGQSRPSMNEEVSRDGTELLLKIVLAATGEGAVAQP
jgi:hypothetical protein